MTDTAVSPLGVVLVHGAWHGPRCWETVRDLLEARGLETHAPTLPSTGPDPYRLGSFDDDVEAVRQAVDGAGPVILCAHSYGGLVAGALHHPNVRHLVFLTAFMADEGEDWSAVAADEPPTLLASALTFDDHGNVLVDPEKAQACFYSDCDPTEAQAAIRHLQPQATEPFARPMPVPSWRTIPSTFVVCTEDQAISPKRQREMAERATTTRQLPTSHSAMLARPDLVAEILAELACAGTHAHA